MVTPRTNCPICSDAEDPSPHWLKRVRDLRRRYLPTRGEVIASAGRGMSAVMLASTGRTWYQSHYDSYVATGDEIHLTRAMRHVTLR